MPRGLTRNRSTLPGKRKRSSSRIAAGELVELDEDKFELVEEETIKTPDVLEKYRRAGQIANEALRKVLSLIKIGASVLELCQEGDKFIQQRTASEYSNILDEDGNPIHRGVAFPCCVSVNHCICHFHPTDPNEDIVLKPGDVVRVELSVHIDGYIATVAHTIIVDLDSPTSIDSKIKADVLRAAFTAGQAALRVMKPGFTNHDVTEVFRSVAYSFGVMPCQGVLSHRMKRFEEQGDQIILSWECIEDSQLQPTITFRGGQVWSLDVVFMNGCTAANNILKVKEHNPAHHYIFRKSEVMKNMRVKASRYVLAVLRENGPSGILPFTREPFDDSRQAQLGIFNLVKDQIIDSFPTLWSKPIQCVGRYKWTVLITDKGVQPITGIEAPQYASIDPSRVDSDVQFLLKKGLHVKAMKNTSKKAQKI